MVATDRLDVERRRSVLDEVRYAGGGWKLELVLNVLIEGERRHVWGFEEI